MVSYKTSKRRRNSKRYKRRSLKRKNVKSRKVMRGGAPDPLKDVKKDDLVIVVLKYNAHPRGDISPLSDETVICRVQSVDNIDKQKVVKLVITNEGYRFYSVYGGNQYNGQPTEANKEFEISYTPSDDKTCPYSFRIYKRDDSGNLKVISQRDYTHIVPDIIEDKSKYINGPGYKIKSVQHLRASQ